MKGSGYANPLPFAFGLLIQNEIIFLAIQKDPNITLT
jgi:hypothetical protein